MVLSLRVIRRLSQSIVFVACQTLHDCAENFDKINGELGEVEAAILTLNDAIDGNATSAAKSYSTTGGIDGTGALAVGSTVMVTNIADGGGVTFYGRYSCENSTGGPEGAVVGVALAETAIGFTTPVAVSFPFTLAAGETKDITIAGKVNVSSTNIGQTVYGAAADGGAPGTVALSALSVPITLGETFVAGTTWTTAAGVNVTESLLEVEAVPVA